jgi:hypothetical protein
MSFRDEIKSYTDINGYINPYPVDTKRGRQCDNATMFSSEAAILLVKRLEDNFNDENEWEILINKSSIQPGLTVRYPKDNTTDAPDNLYGILAASKVLDKPNVALDILNYGKSNFGFYNPSNPNHIKNIDGSINWSNFQWRQPQLLFAMLCSSNTYKWYKFYYWFLDLYTALTIIISCFNTEISDTDSRRLCWLLIQSTQNDSLFCKLASKIWFKRLYKDYLRGMNDVANVYYKPTGNNPFGKYWVT